VGLWKKWYRWDFGKNGIGGETLEIMVEVGL